MPISFTANLITDKSYAKTHPWDIPAIYFENLKKDYENFLSTDTIAKVLTEGDTICLSAKNEPEGFRLNIDYYEKGKEKPYNWFIQRSRGYKHEINYLNELKSATYWFIAQKSGIEQKFGEGYFKFVKRGVTEYIKQKCGKKTDL